MRRLLICLLPLLIAGCATLGQLRNFVHAPRFDNDDRPAEITFLQPSRDQPLGGAGIRIWTRVTNPNPFGLTLTTLSTTLMLDGRRAATSEFPLGLPLGARQESTVPLDVSVDFSDLPGLAGALRRITGGERVEYQLDGTVGVDAGPIGQPTFGPMTIVRGDVSSIRRGPDASQH
jgi:hypothetical protein